MNGGKRLGAGRKKGVPNKITPRFRETVQQILDRLDCRPAEEMAIMAMNSVTPVVVRAKLFTELAGYLYPKQRSLEVSGPDGKAIQIHFSTVREDMQKQ